MKIACICNMNNNFFTIVRYLRDRGFDADLLLLNNEHSHFHPSKDTFDLAYQDYTINLSWGGRGEFKEIPQRKIKEDLEPYDFIIACGTAPAFIEKASRVIDVFIPYGGDLIAEPFADFRVYKRSGLRSIVNRMYQFRIAQKKAIQKSACINLETGVAFIRSAVDELNVWDKIYYFGIPMVYLPLYRQENLVNLYKSSAWYEVFKDIRDRSDFMIFSHSRQVWKEGAIEFDKKGNDKLITGFANFMSKTKYSTTKLVMFEYGSDVSDSKELVKQLGIEGQVVWMPKMARKEIMLGISLSDIGTGQFFHGGIGGGTSWEVISLGKPLMHYYKLNNPHSSVRSGMYKFINVRTAEEITAALFNIESSPDKYSNLGKDAFVWYKNYVEKSMDTLDKIIQSKRSESGIQTFIKDLKINGKTPWDELQ